MKFVVRRYELEILLTVLFLTSVHADHKSRMEQEPPFAAPVHQNDAAPSYSGSGSAAQMQELIRHRWPFLEIRQNVICISPNS
jgi:hypothetical protein